MKTPTQPPKPVESALRGQKHDAFIARALASREEAKQTGVYFDAREVHDQLRVMLAQRVRQKDSR